MSLVKIQFDRDGDHVVYNGPHGPLRFHAGQSPETAVIVTPDGEDRLDFGMARDVGALDTGVGAVERRAVGDLLPFP